MSPEAGRAAAGDGPLEAIDRVVHEPARLLILSQLHVVETADFLFMEKQTGLTRGNLSSHIGKLEAAGYIDVKKEFVGKRPHTLLRLTDRGRAALETYVARMKPLFEELSGGA